MNVMLPIISALLAIFYLAKDWGAHKTSLRRVFVLCLIILAGLGGAVNNYYADKKANAQISGLQKAVETATKNQGNNTKHFVEAFGKLSSKVSVLQTQIKTTELRKEADQLKEELVATQKALTPPKTALTLSFSQPDVDAPPLRTITLPMKNNIVHVNFAIRNDTDIPALDGDMSIIICPGCKFVSEIPNYYRLSGRPDTELFRTFDRILAKTHIYLSVDVQVPPNVSGVGLDMVYRCKNCIVPKPHENLGLIYLSR